MSSRQPCGTYGGYQRCKRRPAGACAPCRRANADYIRRWRQDRSVSYACEKSKQLCRDRALRRLAALHPADLRALYEEELAKLPDPFPASKAARAS